MSYLRIGYGVWVYFGATFLVNNTPIQSTVPKYGFLRFLMDPLLVWMMIDTISDPSVVFGRIFHSGKNHWLLWLKVQLDAIVIDMKILERGQSELRASEE